MRIWRREDLRFIRLVAIFVSAACVLAIVIYNIPHEQLVTATWFPQAVLVVLIHVFFVAFYDKVGKIPTIRVAEFVSIQLVVIVGMILVGQQTAFVEPWQLVSIIVVINAVGLGWFLVVRTLYRPRYGLLPSPLAKKLRRLTNIDAVEVNPGVRLRDQGVTVLVLDHSSSLQPDYMPCVTEAIVNAITITSAVDLYERMTGRTPVRELDDISSDFTRSIEKNYDRVKAVIDFLLTPVLFLLILIPFLIIALIVALTSRGTVFFTQARVGQNGKKFMIIKFRTLYSRSAEGDSNAVHGASAEPHITPFGRFLRKSRLDELPQLVNVMRGEMSLIGPRPEWDYLARQLSRELSLYNFRHVVRPGITGWAQVNFRYAQTTNATMHKLEYDIYYNRNRSLELDLFILLRTLLTVLRGTGT